jgi:HAMP domain-containing protein
VSLAVRLLLAVGLVAVLATALVGWSVRDASREIIESDFNDRIEAAASGVSQELGWEAEGLRGLLSPLCEHDTFVDKAQLELDRVKGDIKALDPGRWIAIRHFVPDQASALRLDDLVLVTADGAILGAVDVARIGTRDARLAALIKLPAGPPRLRPTTVGAEPTMEVHCARPNNGVGLVGARKIAKILDRVGLAYRVKLTVVDPGAPLPKSSADVVVRPLDFTVVSGLKVVASVPQDELKSALAKLDRSIVITGATAIGLALVIAFILARSLSRPLVALAHETREVVAGEPKRVKGRGGSEIAALAESFNRTIDELTTMRRRVAATERIHARRDVARQIAHEIKNPLAPIRAAGATIRPSTSTSRRPRRRCSARCIASPTSSTSSPVSRGCRRRIPRRAISRRWRARSSRSTRRRRTAPSRPAARGSSSSSRRSRWSRPIAIRSSRCSPT